MISVSAPTYSLVYPRVSAGQWALSSVVTYYYKYNGNIISTTIKNSIPPTAVLIATVTGMSG